MSNENSNEIKKALECCSEAELKEDCKKLKCPFFDNETYNCMNVDDENAMYRYSLDLINQLESDLQLLKNDYENVKSAFDETVEKNQRLREKLMKATHTLKNIKSEAVKEFAERLCEDRVSNDPVVIAVKAELKETCE